MDNFLVWQISPEIFSIGFLKVRWYSMMFVIGFIASYYIMRRMFRAEGLNEEKVSSLLTYVILGTIIGARLGYCLFYQPEHYLANPLEILKTWKGGLASHGGFTGVAIAIFIYCRRHKIKFLWLIDRASVVALLIAGLIRIGNFINGEIVGTPSQLPWAIIFPNVDKVPRHPVVLYESITYFLIFALLSILFWRTSIRQHPGRLWGVALAVSFGARFILEFFKKKQFAFEHDLILNMGHVLSVPFVSLGLFLIFITSSSKRPS